MKCWLKVITYRYIQTPVFSESTVFARLDRIVSLSILSSRLSSNSCSAALICVFVLREEFGFLFQTFSRSDPPGKALLTRRRYVFKKREKEKEFGFDIASQSASRERASQSLPKISQKLE